MEKQSIRDRFWIWGMPVNALQALDERVAEAFGRSTITVGQAMQRTGAHNVILAGGLPISRESVDAVPSARRILCKTALHRPRPGGDGMSAGVLDEEACLARLAEAKKLAAGDARIEGFLIDDFSTGTIDAGVKPEHLSRLQFANASCGPHLPLNGTIYTMTLDRPELPALLPHLTQLLVPLWHADQIAGVPAVLDRLSELTSGKPMMLCLYLYDFGNKRPIPRELMQQHLDLAEDLPLASRVCGLVICGTCMMDLEWPSNQCLYEWLDRVGDRTIGRLRP